MTNLICAVDIGGTFTDCTLVSEDGNVATAKSISTHRSDLTDGFFNSISTAAEKFGYEGEEVFEDIIRISHGTTVATNTMVEEQGAKTGLITTHGLEDIIEFMRGSGRPTGEPPENVFDFESVSKPDPIVPDELVYGVPERVDSEGNVIVELDEDATRSAVRDLVDKGVDAIAISLIWSFYHPDHEIRIGEIIEEEAPDVYVSSSHKVSPTLGEYERTVATCINAMVGPEVSSYVGSVAERLKEEKNYHQPLLMMQSDGGNSPADLAAETPVTLIGSGPVGGVEGALKISKDIDKPNVLATDMGGTSFEFGLIQDQEPLVDKNPVIQKYRYRLPKVDIKSIGAGGGSIASIKQESNSLRVGPESAGADPGPACYDLGGNKPTVTDANLLLGFIDPEATLGGDIELQKDRAEKAVDELADKLGLSILETAKGIFDITNVKMGNLMRNEVIGRGFDPRDFTVIAYGGAGPLHASSYADQLNINEVYVPGSTSAAFSAYGISQSDIVHTAEQQVDMQQPFDPEEMQTAFEALEEEGREVLAETKFGQTDIQTHRNVSMQYQGQQNEIEMTVPGGKLTQDNIEDLISSFEAEYEGRYTPTARVPQAPLEILSLRSTVKCVVEKYDRVTTTESGASPTKAAEKSSRKVYVGEERGQIDVPVYDGTELHPGNKLEGPVIIDLPDTSIVAHENQAVSVNKYNDFKIEVN